MRLEQLAQPEPQGDEISSIQLVEMIRAEISAAQTLRRTVLIRRVCTRLQLNEHYREVVNNAVEKLVKKREILDIGQGLVTVTPIRVIELSSVRVLVLSALPTLRLQSLLAQLVEGEENRSIKVNSSSLATAIENVDGKLLSVEDYANIDHAPVANQQWLYELTRRQMDVMSNNYHAESAESYRWYRKKWLLFADADAPAEPNLWRGEDCLAKQIFLWATKMDLVEGRGLRLTQSDACRTKYALDRAAGHTHSMFYRKNDDGYSVALDCFLPINEFKALSCFSYAQDNNASQSSYAIYADCMEPLSSLLMTQLGIELVEEV